MQKAKDPALAAILSFIICGSGQIYNGDVPKGVILFVVACIFGIIFLPLALIPAIYAAFDAYNSAKLRNGDVEIEEQRNKDYIDVTDFTEKLKRLSSLLNAGMINQEEFEDRKKNLIADICMKKLQEDPLDFLAALVPLKQGEILTDDDISVIKKLV
ncbi:SHOCT domain-containing protein [Serratia fonticola]